MNDRPLLLLCDPEGRVFEHPHLRSMGRSGPHTIEVDEWIPLPEGSKLFSLPGRVALGWDEDGQRLQRVSDIRERNRNFAPTPVAAFLPPGFVRTHLPAAEILPDAPILPTWAYSCVAWYQDQFVAAAYRIDANEKWQPDQYDDRDLLPRIQELSAVFPRNRLLVHLTRCATHYHCFAAKNLFFGRWEAPLPVAPTCNASCLGCLSWQPGDSHPSSHDRIRFRPTVEEICQIAVHHLETAPDPIVSFGQGCEGEPLLEHKLIGEAIRAIRQETDRGTIHLNTNGSLPAELEQLLVRGLDSVRISLNSLLPERYEAYFRPEQYSFSDVKRSAEIVRNARAYLHINLLVFPGLSDQQREIDLLLEWIETIGIDRIQLKNLCIDPDMYVNAMPGLDERGKGMRHLRDTLRNCAPQVSLGYFNIPKEEFDLPCEGVRSEVVSRVGETP
jgi:wyosine [tRNA(Phe)-imidazoG37] synthetase (radical SAM superfamily)